jgi:hypothetical protein
MRKQIFFLLSSMVICMPISGMEHEDQKGLVAFPPEMICKVINHCNLQSIGRLKRVNKQLNEQFNEYEIVKIICPLHRVSEHPCQFIQHLEVQKATYAVCTSLFNCFVERNDYYMTHQFVLLLQKKEKLQKQQDYNDDCAEYYRSECEYEERLRKKQDEDFFIGTGLLGGVIGSCFLIKRLFFK